jgi:amino acid adenylation domain-containing protein
VIDAFEKKMRKKIFAAVRIQASHAIHSAMMEPVVEEFKLEVEKIKLNKPRIPYLSNVTGDWVTDREAVDPGYWSNHLLSAVQFNLSIIKLLEKEKAVFIEVGPGNAVCSLIQRRKDTSPRHVVVNLTRLPQEDIADEEFLLNKLGYLALCGLEIDWRAYHAGNRRRRIPLPTYPFEGKKYWLSGDPYNIAAGAAPEEAEAVTVEPEAEVPSARFDRPRLGTLYVAPETETEHRLVDIFRDFMGIREIGISDNFFDLGSDSLKLMTISLKIHKEMGIKLPVAEFFRSPTIRELARAMDDSGLSRGKLMHIEPVEEQSYYDVSNGQRRMWVLHQFDEEQSGYNMPAAFTFDTPGAELNVPALTLAFRGLIHRHEILRTRFEVIGGVLRQVVLPASQVNFEIHRQDMENQPQEELRGLIRSYASGVFDLAVPPLFRAKVLTLEPGKHIFLFNMHHIISDGWSMNIFIKELTTLYEHYIQNYIQTGSGSPADADTLLPPLSIQYKEYAAWQNAFLASESTGALKAYWLGQLSGEAGPLPVTALPTDHPRPAFKTFHGNTLFFELEPELSAGIHTLCGDTGATLFMVLLAAAHVLLYRYTGQEDIIIGSPIAGRNHPDLEEQIGLYINMLALRSRVIGGQGFKAFLEQVKQTATGAYEHQAYPFDRLVDDLDLERDTSRHPLFDVVVILQNTPQTELTLEGIRIGPVDESLAYTTSNYDMTFNFEEKEGVIHLAVEYCTGLFETNRIRNMWNHFSNLVRNIILQPDKPVQSLDILSDRERHLLLQIFNDTAANYPADKSIIDLFEAQVEQTPDHTALIGVENRTYWTYRTYKQLNRQAGQVALRLKEKGVQPANVVALKMERSVDMPLHMLGILKAGAAYLPIDPHMPKDRIDFILKDSNAILHTPEPLPPAEPAPLNDAPGAGDAAYVIYTSGSTGKPKGVVIEHRGVVAFSLNMEKIFGISGEDRVYALTTYTFDISVLELICGLLGGSSVVVEPFSEDAERVKRNIVSQGISVMQVTPSRLGFFIDTLGTAFLSYIRVLLVGGEPLPRPLWEALANLSHLSAYNVYGPTEATIWSSAGVIGNGRVTIGKPLLNESVYILSNAMQPVPVGVPGEIYIGGAGVGRGYLNQPGLTSGKFIAAAGIHESPIQVYKTGDLGRWTAGGDIEFLGRADHQVKIRGFRIELGEIEHHLLTYPAVEETAVIVTMVEGAKQLTAFIAGDLELNDSTLTGIKEHLGQFLPDHMIPHYYECLDRLPLTASAKIDRAALARLPVTGAQARKPFTAPRNEIEEKLVRIWETVLKRENIGVEDNFFNLGGHSLKATQMVSSIHKELSIDISLRDIFKSPTIDGLARLAGEKETVPYAEIEPVASRAYYDVSNAQRRVWVLNQFSQERITYNMPSVFTLRGQLSIDALNRAFDWLIKRHESLRTSFSSVEGMPVQVVHDSVIFSITCENFEDEADHLDRRIVKHAATAFDLSTAPLLNVKLLKSAEDLHHLLFNIHHIICDGWSVGVLVRELTSAYRHYVTTPDEAPPYPDLRIQYKDYTAWQDRLLQNENIENVKSYWRRRFADIDQLPVLDLPLDRPRPPVKTHHGDAIDVELDAALVKGLYDLSRQHELTLFMTLLAAVHLLLYRYTGQGDIITGSPIAGRNHPELENQVGFYVNTLALRFCIEPAEPFEAFLRQVKQNASDAYENQAYPFDRLVDELDLERDTSRNPLFDVMVILQNAEPAEFKLPGLEITPVDSPFHTSKFDLTFSFMEEDANGPGPIKANIEYNTDLFNRDRILRLWSHFTELVKSITLNPAEKPGQINLLPEQEKKQLLDIFNETRVDYPPEKTILQLFTDQVERAPDHIAVSAAVSGDNRSHKSYRTYKTYKELDRQSNRLARYLVKEAGVAPGDIAAVKAERGPFILVALLAILKTGAVYLPIDPSYPRERIDYMLSDSAPKTFIDSQTLKEEADVDAMRHEGAEAAYVIYTSGSTGKPKGVLGTLKCLTNLIHWQMNTFNTSETGGLRMILYSALNFDVSIQEMLFSACTGGTLYVLSDELKRNPDQLADFFRRHAIELITLPFSALNLLFYKPGMLTNVASLKHIITSGEQLQITENIGQFLKERPEVLLHNQYGPSETHVVTSYTLSGDQTGNDPLSPIGKPVSNTSCYILDQHMNLAPIGITGELYIAGVHLASGYLNNPALANKKFLEVQKPSPMLGDPIDASSEATGFYTSDPIESSVNRVHAPRGGRRRQMYRTGDRACWLADGNIRFLGRVDQQVKIRGFRVEPGEIEARLLSHPGVREAVVLVREDPMGDKYLGAAIIPVEQVTGDALKEHLGLFLPDYMIPVVFVLLERFPVMASGKTDKRAVARLMAESQPLETTRAVTAPVSEIEVALVRIWEEVLNRESIGIHDNFFHLGGHSLKATQVVSRIHRDLSLNIELHDIFTTPTIAGLVEIVNPGQRVEAVRIEPVAEQTYYEASHAQKRLWVIHSMEENLTAYNIPMALELSGGIDIQAFIKAMHTIVERHETLRTTFFPLDGDPKQKIHSYGDFGFKLEILDLRDREDRDKTAGEMAVADAVKPFNLETGPLIRARLLHMEDRRFILLLNLHHIIADGWSTQVMRYEIFTLYNAYVNGLENPLLPLKVHYKDFATWQNRNIREADEQYWLTKLSGRLSLVNFIYDFPREDFNTFEGSMERLTVPAELTQILNAVARQNNVTLSTVMLSVFNIFLSQLTGQTDMLVASSIANRVNPDIEKLIGFFVNMLIIRCDLSRDLSFEEFLLEVHQAQLEAFEHQGYPFDLLVEKLNPRRHTNYQPLFNVGFAFQNFADVTIQLDMGNSDQAPPQPDFKAFEMRSLHEETNHFTSIFDLVLFAAMSGGQLELTMEYNSRLFKSETIRAYLEDIDRFIRYIAEQTAVTAGTSNENEVETSTNSNSSSDHEKEA